MRPQRNPTNATRTSPLFEKGPGGPYPFARADCLSLMSSQLRDLPVAINGSWRRFIDVYEPLRPDLFRYCRHLTRSPWDAEDLVQDTLARAYVTLGCMTDAPPNPRAWLFRVASNLWINRTRRAREVPAGTAASDAAAPLSEPRDTREAAGTLLSQLSPQERAAVVLKDVFALSLEETAEALSTSPGAIKAALHRGRTKLVDPEPREPGAVVPEALDAFCAAFNARDLDRLTALLLDTATMEFPGVLFESGAPALRAGSLHNTLFGCPDGHYLPSEPPRCEVRLHRDEPILLWWVGAEVDTVVRVTIEGALIAGLRNHRHAPELITEVCRELGVPFRTHGYQPSAGGPQ
jgi:RNA polymerase sigma-70 factor (ECF subfamily)